MRRHSETFVILEGGWSLLCGAHAGSCCYTVGVKTCTGAPRNRTIHVEAPSRQRGLMVLHALWAWGLVALCLVCGPRCGALVQATSGPRRPRHDSGLETWVPPKQQPITFLSTFPLPAANSVHEIPCITSVESGSRVYSLQHVYTF